MLQVCLQMVFTRVIILYLVSVLFEHIFYFGYYHFFIYFYVVLTHKNLERYHNQLCEATQKISDVANAVNGLVETLGAKLVLPSSRASSRAESKMERAVNP